MLQYGQELSVLNRNSLVLLFLSLFRVLEDSLRHSQHQVEFHNFKLRYVPELLFNRILAPIQTGKLNDHGLRIPVSPEVLPLPGAKWLHPFRMSCYDPSLCRSV